MAARLGISHRVLTRHSGDGGTYPHLRATRDGIEAPLLRKASFPQHRSNLRCAAIRSAVVCRTQCKRGSHPRRMTAPSVAQARELDLRQTVRGLVLAQY